MRNKKKHRPGCDISTLEIMYDASSEMTFLVGSVRHHSQCLYFRSRSIPIQPHHNIMSKEHYISQTPFLSFKNRQY